MGKERNGEHPVGYAPAVARRRVIEAGSPDRKDEIPDVRDK